MHSDGGADGGGGDELQVGDEVGLEGGEGVG